MQQDDDKTKEQLLEELGQLRRENFGLRAKLKRAEQALQTSSHRLRLLTDCVPAYVAYVGAKDLHYYYVSQKFEEAFDRSREEIVGTHIRNLIGEENYKFALPYIAQVRAGQPVSYINTFRIAQGRRWIKVNYVPDFDTQGQVVGIVVLSYDVTEQKQTEQDLLESQKRFELFMQHLPGAAFIKDQEGRLLYCNECFASLINRRLEDLIGKETEDYTPVDIAADFLRENAEMLHHNRVLEREHSYPGPDGLSHWLTIKFPILRDGEPPLVGAMSLDISMRKQAEEALQEREALLESIFRVAPIGIGLTRNRVLVEVNDYICEMTGYARQELVGKDSSVLYPTQVDYDFVGSEKYRQIAETGTGTVETRWQSKDGRIINVLLSSTPLNFRDVAEGVTFAALDITERKRLEEQYHQAQKMEALGRLTGGVAHDFNNLLTVINGFAELMQLRLAPDHSLQEMLKQIIQSGQRATDLVHQLLAFSRKQIIEPKILDLNNSVSGVEKMLQRLIGEDIQMEVVLAPDLWPVRVDPVQIEQVIVNLVVNARDAMPRGGQLVLQSQNIVLDDTFTRHLDIRPGDYVMISVSDSGVGMEEEVMAHIFEPFFTTKEMGRGTGLGLATIYGIVKQSDGHIEVESASGRGTIFKVYLPSAQPRTAEQAVLNQKTELPTGRETILLVEDDDDVRDLVSTMLRNLGYLVLEAENGITALELSASYLETIDLLLTDVIMPEMDGRQLAGQLTERRHNLKVLFMSGYTNEAIARYGILEPGLTLIEKPMRWHVLARQLRIALDDVARDK